MGLDMYLMKTLRGSRLQSNNSTEIAYWRKANQIHDWFVRNVQNGYDDCGKYEVTKEDLQALLSTCKEVLASITLVDMDTSLNDINNEWPDAVKIGKTIKDPTIAKALLPTCPGFFFGDIEYDEIYKDNIERTIEQLERILRETNFNNYKITYQSSW